MAITGRVPAPDGQPVPDTFVTALRKSPVPGRGNTFYPGVAAFAEARSVHVRPGVSPAADITLLPAPIRTTSGVVIGSNGQPVPGGRLAVTHGDGFFGLATRALRIGADGTFHATGLQPGTYFLQFRESQWPPPRGVIPQVSRAEATITDTDVTGVRVVPQQMVRGSGRLVVDAGDHAALDAGTVRVSAFPDPVDGNPGPQRPGTARPDLTFEFQTWPQPSRIRTEPIDFVQGKEVTGLEVVITWRPDRR